MVVCRREELYDLNLSTSEEEVLVYLLRNYPGLFADYVNITETVIASHLSMTAEQVYQTLLSLSRRHILHYVPRRLQPYLYFQSRRIQKKHIEIPREIYDTRRQRMQERIDAMLTLSFGNECRANTILRYFGEEPTDSCQTCDVCRQNSLNNGPKKPSLNLKEQIRYALSSGKEVTVTELAETLNMRPEAITETIRSMVDRGEITLKKQTLCKLP